MFPFSDRIFIRIPDLPRIFSGFLSFSKCLTVFFFQIVFCLWIFPEFFRIFPDFSILSLFSFFEFFSEVIKSFSFFHFFNFLFIRVFHFCALRAHIIISLKLFEVFCYEVGLKYLSLVCRIFSFDLFGHIDINHFLVLIKIMFQNWWNNIN